MSWPLILETRMTHHWRPNLARLSRFSSSIHEPFFFGFSMSFISTSSFQFAPLFLSLLSLFSRLLSRALTWERDSTEAERVKALFGREEKVRVWKRNGFHGRNNPLMSSSTTQEQYYEDTPLPFYIIKKYNKNY